MVLIDSLGQSVHISEGRIPGCKRFGRAWVIPKDAKKPERLTPGVKKAASTDRTAQKYESYFFECLLDLSNYIREVYAMNVRDLLHAKRMKTEKHIRELERKGKAGSRYTATLPDLPFLILGLLCDAGWIVHLAAGGCYLFRRFSLLLLLSMIALAAGVGMVSYLGFIHEKEIALGCQKDLSFGLTVLAGLAGGIIGSALGSGWIAAGGFLNFTAGLPIYLSFKPGIRYGIQ